MTSLRRSLALSLLAPLLFSGSALAAEPSSLPTRDETSTGEALAVLSTQENLLLRASAAAGTSVAREQARLEAAAERKRLEEERARKARLQRIAERKAEERRERREARIAARTATTSGILGDLSFFKTRPVEGTLTTAAANIPSRTSPGGWVRSMNQLTSQKPDFITLNEVGQRSTENIQSLAPAYGIVRGERDYSPGGTHQSLNNVVLYRADTWTRLAGGMVKVVDDDRGFMGKKPFLWDRYATWALLKRTDGAVVSVISVHMPTNPGKYPKQHGNPALSRIGLYAKGMDTIKAMEAQLAQYGPVIVAGDMNSHAGQGDWTAVAKMATIGYGYTKDRGVMHIFHKTPATVAATRQLAVVSDHPALVTTLAMNGYSVG